MRVSLSPHTQGKYHVPNIAVEGRDATIITSWDFSYLENRQCFHHSVPDHTVDTK